MSINPNNNTTTLYRYGLQFRPLQGGAQPKGFIPNPEGYRSTPDWENPDTRYGWLDYPTKLSDEDVKAYELKYLGEVTVTDAEITFCPVQTNAAPSEEYEETERTEIPIPTEYADEEMTVQVQRMGVRIRIDGVQTSWIHVGDAEALIHYLKKAVDEAAEMI